MSKRKLDQLSADEVEEGEIVETLDVRVARIAEEIRLEQEEEQEYIDSQSEDYSQSESESEDSQFKYSSGSEYGSPDTSPRLYNFTCTPDYPPTGRTSKKQRMSNRKENLLPEFFNS
jgi:hypothetical protein